MGYKSDTMMQGIKVIHGMISKTSLKSSRMPEAKLSKSINQGKACINGTS